MNEAVQLLQAHGPLLLFFVILADQAGLPFPMEPFLVAAGAMMAGGALAPLPAGLSLLAAGFLGNVAWYALGRRFGSRLLGFSCRLALEPDSCVKRTENLFTRHGVKSLLVSKFVPGLDVLGPPLAGAFGVPLGRFVLFDVLGLAIWLGAYVGLGALLRDQVEDVVSWLSRFGSAAAWGVGAALALYIAYKYVHRQMVKRRLRLARISAEDLKKLMDAPPGPVVVDLRHRLAARERPVIIPGALVFSPDEVEARHGEIPRDRDVILYCA
jgi:membrane protein DedA with SNARE-associated domain